MFAISHNVSSSVGKRHGPFVFVPSVQTKHTGLGFAWVVISDDMETEHGRERTGLFCSTNIRNESLLEASISWFLIHGEKQNYRTIKSTVQLHAVEL
jgi:hypothetical protein